MLKSLISLLVGVVLISFGNPNSCFALEDITLLPKGARALMFRQGVISEIGNKYSSNYQLGSIQYRTSRRVDSSLIKDLNSEFDELVKIMNKEFPGYDLGDKIYLGDLIIDGEPEVDFKAPVFAYGVTDSFTFAIGIPIVKFKANITARHEGSHNIEEIKAAMPSEYRSFRGSGSSFSSRLDDAYRQLEDSSNLTEKLRELCEDKELKCLGEHKQNTIGDIQLINRFLIHRDERWAFMYRAHVNLPTGPEDDPDNLVDLPIFHRTFVDNMLVSQFNMGPWKFHNALGYVLQVPDRMKRRVPKSSNDILPDKDRTENLKRKIGDTFKYQFNSFYQWNEDISLGAGFQKEWKAKDSYRGSFSDRDYSLLSKDTSSELLKLELSFGYSTINRFLRKAFPVPLSLSYNFSDIITGKNVERQSLHEINMAVMF